MKKLSGRNLDALARIVEDGPSHSVVAQLAESTASPVGLPHHATYVPEQVKVISTKEIVLGLIEEIREHRSGKQLEQIAEALFVATLAHADQRRKGPLQRPYVNHPIDCFVMAVEAGVRNTDVLCACLLHDIKEDQPACWHEVTSRFNERIVRIVQECSDDKDLPWAMRKALQLSEAQNLSPEAKIVKVCDKLCNIHDIINEPPDWTDERKEDYIRWALDVVKACECDETLCLDTMVYQVRLKLQTLE